MRIGASTRSARSKAVRRDCVTLWASAVLAAATLGRFGHATARKAGGVRSVVEALSDAPQAEPPPTAPAPPVPPAPPRQAAAAPPVACGNARLWAGHVR